MIGRRGPLVEIGRHARLRRRVASACEFKFFADPPFFPLSTCSRTFDPSRFLCISSASIVGSRSVVGPPSDGGPAKPTARDRAWSATALVD